MQRSRGGGVKIIIAGWCALRSASCQDVGDAGGGGQREAVSPAAVVLEHEMVAATGT